MATTTLRVHHRPLRIGFLVEDGSVQQLVRAAELNTGLWGGIFNPVIPVRDDSSGLEQLAKAFRVDLLYPVAKSPRLTAAMAKVPWLPWPRSWARESSQDDSPDALYLAALDVSAIFQRYWETDFRSGGESDCILPQWDPADPLAPIFLLQCGAYPQITGRDLAKDYLGALRAKSSPVASGDVMPDEWVQRHVPLSVTADQLKPDRASREGAGVFWGDPSKFADLAMFWNLRASGGHPIFCPSTAPDRLRDAASAFLRLHWPQVQRLNTFQRRLRLWLMDQAEMDAGNRFAAAVRPEGSEFVINPFNRSDLWSGAGILPVYEFEEHSILADVEKRGDGARVSFEEPEKPLPKELGTRVRNQHWVVTVRPLGEHDTDDLTLSPPYIPELNLEYSRWLAHGFGDVRVEREGIGFIEEVTSRNLTISKLRAREVINGVFSIFGLATGQSRAGLIAERLIRQCGGLEGCRVFKIPGARRLLESDAVKDGAVWSYATKTIYDKAGPEATFEAHKNLFIEYREKQQLSPHDVVTYLLKKQLLRAGLRLTCPTCTLDGWVSLDRLTEEFRCEYCGHVSVLATQLKDRGDWRFRLSGLLARPEGEQGAIPVAMTLLQLLRRHNSTGGAFLWTTGLTLKKGGLSCEADLAVIERNRFTDAPAIVLGECKGRLGIDAEDVRKLSSVAEVLREKSLDCYLLFAKSDAQFTPPELELLRSLRERGFPLILFTAKNLEPYEPYDDSMKDIIPHRYGHTLKEMADNSAALYLSPAGAGGRV
jgi:hypothetical protein